MVGFNLQFSKQFLGNSIKPKSKNYSANCSLLVGNFNHTGFLGTESLLKISKHFLTTLINVVPSHIQLKWIKKRGMEKELLDIPNVWVCPVMLPLPRIDEKPLKMK